MELDTRYIVIKCSDLAEHPETTKALLAGLPQRAAVVVEADWPEYAATRQAILSRIINTQGQA